MAANWIFAKLVLQESSYLSRSPGLVLYIMSLVVVGGPGQVTHALNQHPRSPGVAQIVVVKHIYSMLCTLLEKMTTDIYGNCFYCSNRTYLGFDLSIKQ